MYIKKHDKQTTWPDFSVDSWLTQLYQKNTPRLSADHVLNGEIPFKDWQSNIRISLKNMLGKMPDFSDPQIEIAEKTDCKDYERIRVHVTYTKGLTGPMYLLIPHKPLPQNAGVVCPSGHGIGCRAVIGLDRKSVV